jgi:hypothetical protein
VSSTSLTTASSASAGGTSTSPRARTGLPLRGSVISRSTSCQSRVGSTAIPDEAAGMSKRKYPSSSVSASPAQAPNRARTATPGTSSLSKRFHMSPALRQIDASRRDLPIGSSCSTRPCRVSRSAVP